MGQKCRPVGTLPAFPHGGVRPFQQMPTCITRSTSGQSALQIWSRNTPESGPNETLVLHRVEWVFSSRTECSTNTVSDGKALVQHSKTSDTVSNVSEAHELPDSQDPAVGKSLGPMGAEKMTRSALQFCVATNPRFAKSLRTLSAPRGGEKG